ncbi:hypothetical protein Droror1_Dr00017999 [Drosera rotundifolia]
MPVFDMMETVLVTKLNFKLSVRYTECVCCIYNVYRDHFPFLRRSSWFLRRVRIRSHNILSSLHHVACHLQASLYFTVLPPLVSHIVCIVCNIRLYVCLML